jgi:hypothetical protein
VQPLDIRRRAILREHQLGEGRHRTNVTRVG